MIIETALVGATVIAIRGGVLAARERRAEANSRATWLEAIQTSRSINDQLSTARKAMVDEVRRQRRGVQTPGQGIER